MAYYTIQGDTWDNISKKVYGSEMYVNELIQANIAHISTVAFSGNVEINVPEVTKKTSLSDLPPWRR